MSGNPNTTHAAHDQPSSSDTATPTAPTTKTKRPPRPLRWKLRLTIYGSIIASALIAHHVMFRMPGTSHTGPLPPITQQQLELAANLQQHVTHLASTIGERNTRHPNNLNAAADYIQQHLTNLGYNPQRQTYNITHPYDQTPLPCHNIEIEITGSTHPDRIVIIGAHYDSVPSSPGANDNAAGTAALLELARILQNSNPKHTLRLVAFTNEEPPYFTTENQGSYVYAKRSADRNENITAMLSIDGLGYYNDQPNTQNYPQPFATFYPDTANFVGFVGNLRSAPLLRTAVASFRSHTAFPSEGAAVPGFIEGAGWSDHYSFWQFGYPGIMITDTLPFRYKHYHDYSDTPDQLNYQHMARITQGIAHILADLAQATHPNQHVQ